MLTRFMKLTDRYSIYWIRRVCGCWTVHGLSSEANAHHITDCHTYRYGVDWYDHVIKEIKDV